MIKIEGLEAFRPCNRNRGALVNQDDRALEAYREQRALRYQMISAPDRINKLDEEVKDIKKDLGDIKELLLQVLERNK